MKLSIEDGKLTIDIAELADSLTPEQLAKFAQYAIFNDRFVEGLVDSLATNWCYEDDGLWQMSNLLLERLRAKLVPRMPEVIAEHIRQLVNEREREREHAHRWRTACWELQRYWDEKNPVQVFGRIDYSVPQTMNAEQAKAYIERIQAQVDRLPVKTTRDEEYAILSGDGTPDPFAGPRCGIEEVTT